MTAARQIAEERVRFGARLERATRRLTAMQDERNALAVLAGVTDQADLVGVADRVTARNRLRSEIQSLRDQLAQQGDGLSEAALREEWGALPADVAVARMHGIDEDDRALVEELGAIRAETEIAQRKHAELEGGRGAESAAQEEAIAAAGLAALASDYARLEAAYLLATLAIERHRSRYQDPLISRASHLFTALTGQSFACLALDYRSDMLTLAAARADGQRVPIAGLSEGTLDQLYLALRLAALGEFAARADPLPFICDDLLVSFDDARAGLALDVLAEASKDLQVILFTHHRHIVDLAKARLKDKVDVITL
jgi:chromosome segregation protein